MLNWVEYEKSFITSSQVYKIQGGRGPTYTTTQSTQSGWLIVLYGTLLPPKEKVIHTNLIYSFQCLNDLIRFDKVFEEIWTDKNNLANIWLCKDFAEVTVRKVRFAHSV